MLSAKSIKNKKFEKGAFGYRAEEVDEYLEEIAAGVLHLNREYSEMEKKLQTLADEIVKHRDQEKLITEAVLTTQKQSNAILSEAQEKADQILQDAEVKVETLLKDGQQQYEEKSLKYINAIERESSELLKLRNEVSVFKKKLFDMYKEHLAAITEMPEVDENTDTYAEYVDDQPYDDDTHDLYTEPQLELETESEDTEEQSESPNLPPFATTPIQSRKYENLSTKTYSNLQFGENNSDS
ncbi:MAG: DivIVA domain-containing protein [Oscillospiraceae bacterium]|jgi:cell division initiation protein|nr:DivIVA domain-containing protein [Oscillospiraceae bacterium]